MSELYMVVGPRGSLENHSIQCNGGPSRPSAPTERVVEFSHVERSSEMFPLAEKNFISYALEITETFEEAVDYGLKREPSRSVGSFMERSFFNV